MEPQSFKEWYKANKALAHTSVVILMGLFFWLNPWANWLLLSSIRWILLGIFFLGLSSFVYKRRKQFTQKAQRGIKMPALLRMLMIGTGIASIYFWEDVSGFLADFPAVNVFFMASTVVLIMFAGRLSKRIG